MFLFLWISVEGDVTTEISGTVLFVKGEGEITQTILRSKGDFNLFTEVIIETGPSIIRKESFFYMSSLLKLTISDTIKLIEEDQFYSCSKISEFVVHENNSFFSTDGICLYDINKTMLLKAIVNPSSLVIADTVIILCKRCFDSTTYRKPLVIPSSIESIHDRVFTDCLFSEVLFPNCRIKTFSSELYYARITTLHIPPSVESILSLGLCHATITNLIFDNIEESNCTLIKKSFQYYNGKNVTLPPKISQIPSEEFLNSKLEYINIPRYCSYVAQDAFKGCVNLKQVRVDDGNQFYKTIGDALYNKEETHLVFVPPTSSSLSISSKLESISDSLLQLLDFVSELNVNSCNQFYAGYKGCLYNKTMDVLIAVCGGVKALQIFNETTKIAEQACRGVGIVSVEFEGNKVKSIGSYAFSNCKSLQSIVIAASVSQFGTYVFSESGTDNFSFECEKLSALKSFGGFCFYSSNLNSIVLSENITSIPEGCFQYVYKLEHIEIRGTISIMYQKSFFSSGKENTEFRISKSITHISNDAFYNCKFILSFEEDSQLTVLRTSAFYNCKWKSKSIEIPRNVQNIPSRCFESCVGFESIIFQEGCMNLTSFRIPPKLVSVDSSAFFECFKLSTFIESHSMEEGSLRVENNILYNSNKTTLIVCPPGLVEAYVSNSVSTIGSNAFYNCLLETVSFIPPSQIKKISENTFRQCIKLSSISLPRSVEVLGKNCFKDCTSIETVTLGRQSLLRHIEDEAFSNCIKLSQFGFAEATSLESIGTSSFSGCESLSECIIKSTKLKSIGQSSFSPSGLETFEESSSVDIDLGKSLFKNCLKISKITLKSTKYLPDSIFEGCESLKEFDFDPKITKIGDRSFANCVGLRSMNVFSNVSMIGSEAFFGCSNLKYITYCGIFAISSRCMTSLSAVPVYVTKEYPVSAFCGVPVLRHLSSDCIILLPSELFTKSILVQNSFVPKALFQAICSEAGEG